MVSTKVRFEIFKRDLFTCQYCGRSAPEVELHIDHITPQAKGGTDEVSNLITACSECNYAKNDILLSDKSYTIDTVESQSNALKDVKERKLRFKLFMLYKKELEELEELETNEILSFVYKNKETGYVREFHNVRNLIKKYGFNVVYSAMEQCLTKIFTFEDREFPLSLDYLPAMCESLCCGDKDISVIESNFIIKAIRDQLLYDGLKYVYNPENDIFDELLKILKEEYHPKAKEWVNFTQLFMIIREIIEDVNFSKESRYNMIYEYVKNGKYPYPRPY